MDRITLVYYYMNNLDTTKYNVDEVLREAISSLKNDSRFLSITIQPENYDEQKSNVLQPVNRQTLLTP